MRVILHSVPQDTEMMELLLKIQKHPQHKRIDS